MPDRTRVYVDLVGDLFHVGHVELLRAARSFGDWLVVGVLADDVVAAYKRRPITTLDERVAVIRACRYVDEVVPDAPDIVTLEFLRVHDISVVVHGDDLSDEAIAAVYADVAAAGMLRLVPRCTGVSTTELIRRVRDRGHAVLSPEAEHRTDVRGRGATGSRTHPCHWPVAAIDVLASCTVTTTTRSRSSSKT